MLYVNGGGAASAIYKRGYKWVFGLLAPVNDYRVALLWAGGILMVASIWALWLPETPRELEAI